MVKNELRGCKLTVRPMSHKKDFIYLDPIFSAQKTLKTLYFKVKNP